MKERPILFSGAMVRAILAGSKSQTRRVVKPQPPEWIDQLHGNNFRRRAPYDLICPETEAKMGFGFATDEQMWKCPYGAPGDRLWVRETFSFYAFNDDCELKFSDGALRHTGPGAGDIPDAALASYFKLVDRSIRKKGTVSVPSIHMPRWASRILLEVSAVRVERLQDITLADICAEGLAKSIYDFKPVQAGFQQWCELWDSINAKRGHGWKLNPWVWVVEFRRVLP